MDRTFKWQFVFVFLLGLVFSALIALVVAPPASGGFCDGWGRAFIYDVFSVQKCLTEGKDPNVNHEISGKTPLMEAATIGDLQAVHLLLNAGARVGTKDKAGMTAIDWAKRFNRVLIVKLLEQKQSSPRPRPRRAPIPQRKQQASPATRI